MRGGDSDASGIVYFLGNVTSHVVHALPLWRVLGGEFVVLSHEARRRLEPFGVPIRVIDDIPRRWRRTGHRYERTDQYLHVPGAARETLRYLEEKSRVVLFYEFEFRQRLRKPRTVYLSHGNGIKPYFSGRNRVRLVNEQDFVAAPGPYGRELLRGLGVPAKKLADVGLARTDEIVARQGPRLLSPQLRQIVDPPEKARVFTYVPTYWGLSSVDTVGLELVEQVREDQILLVRLHPQTPASLVASYLSAVARRPHVHLLMEDRPGLGLMDLLQASDAVIGDLSSVMVESLLLNRPLVFGVDEPTLDILTSGHPIGRIVQGSITIRSGQRDIDRRLDAVVEEGIDGTLWAQAKEQLFFHADGTAARHIAQFVHTL